MDDHTDGIARAVALIHESHYTVALTGAGISTPSGVPDFRSPGSGLWERVDPMQVASIYAFRRAPEAFYGWFRPLLMTILAAEPNLGHRALAELESEGWLKAVVTQNIDDLHQRAGSHEVLELHGNLREVVCISCYRVVPSQELIDIFISTGQVPRCSVCGGLLKPNAVLLGEQLPIQVVNRAMVHVRQADLMLIAGSSLEVVPASQLPLLVREHLGRLIVVNLTSTYVDEIADVVIHADVAEILPRIARACIGE